MFYFHTSRSAKSSSRRRTCGAKIVAAAGLLTLLVGANVQAQIPDKFTNLKVLPKDISKSELLENMKSFARGLGVRCQYCHVGEEGKPLSTFDFASDKKPEKAAARVMIKMRETINGLFLTQLDREESHGLQVNCVTCHHGQPHPETIEQVLSEELDEKGVEAAIKKYRDLREKYYGGFTYDFQEGVLANFAFQLVPAGRLDEALAILKLNLEFHPQSAITYQALGEVYAMQGDKATAIENLKKSLEIDPQNRRAKNRLEALSQK
ncbi:MAG: c-type cytochrome [bacterium]